MRINPNLYKGDYYFAKDCINYKNSANLKRNEDCVYVDSDQDREPLLFKEVQKIGFDKDDKITITAFIENVGDISINFELTGLQGVFRVFSLNPGESRIYKDSFIVNPDKNQFRFTASQTGRMGVRCVGIKWELGDKVTPYIPNENTIEMSKRQYFIGGGYVQRSIPNLTKFLGNLLLGRRLQYEY